MEDDPVSVDECLIRCLELTKLTAFINLQAIIYIYNYDINLKKNICVCRNALGHKIIGYPIRIDNSRYERNMYLFNLCFVCDSWSKTVQYEPVVKKLGEHLVIFLTNYIIKLWFINPNGYCRALEPR